MYEKDGIVYAGTPTPPISVRFVRPLDDYFLLVVFTNGETRQFNFKPLLDLPCYRPLKDKALFERVYASYGAAVWSDDIDIAPETLYFDGVTVPDDVATADDIAAIEKGLEEYRNGETVSHKEFDSSVIFKKGAR